MAGGFRYERIDYNYYVVGVRLDGQSRVFNNFFPSLSFSTQIGKTQLQLAYTTKINRPSYNDLRSYVSYDNRFLLQTGNPFLRHEYIHDLSLTAVWSFIQAQIGYADRRNAIVYKADQMENNSAVTLLSRDNIPSLKTMKVMVSFAPHFGMYEPQLSLGMQKQWFTFHTLAKDYRLNNPIFQINFNNSFDFGKGWTADASLWYQSKGHGENVKLSREGFQVDLGVKKMLLGDRLSVQVGATDIFKTYKSGYLMFFNTLLTEQIGRLDTREIYVTVRYKFNTVRSKYKGTGAGNAEKSRL